nr:hypothetical protein [uncultured Bacillus sp.]
MRSYLVLSMCFLYIVQYFTQVQWQQYAVVFLALSAFSGSILNANRLPGILGILMMGIGIGVELSKGTGFAGISEGIFLVLPLLCLITLAPLLSIPLKIGGAFRSVSQLLHNLLHEPKKMYVGITGTLFFLSPILNLASVRIINDFLEDLKLPSALTAKSYVVGFATASMWSPYFASVSLMIHYMHISYQDFILYGIGFSLLSLIIGNLLFAIWQMRNPFDRINSAIVPLNKFDHLQILKLVLFVVILMAACLLIEQLTNWSMIVIVCLMTIIVPFFFGVKRDNWRKMTPLLKDFRDRNIPSMSNEIVLFMSAGMLAYSLKGTSVMNGVSDLLEGLAKQSFFLFAFALILIVLCITYIGIHQIAVVGALAMQLSTVDLGVSNLAVALILLLSWAMSMSLSPFSGLNLMVSRFSRLSGRNVGLYANGLHSFISACISVALISLIA